jgi:hypothetical protein
VEGSKERAKGRTSKENISSRHPEADIKRKKELVKLDKNKIETNRP